MMRTAFCILLAAGLLAGCDSRNGIQLRDSDLDGEILRVLPLPAAASPEFSLADLDTAGAFDPAASNAFGQLTIVGATYDDGKSPAREASLVHAALYDRNAPVVAGGRLLGYHGLDVGTVTLDDILVDRAEKRLHADGADTVAGYHYALVNWGQTGGRGFQYTGNHVYQWRIGAGPSPGFTAAILSPPEVKLLGAVNSNNSIAIGRTLKIKWSNRIDRVRILISSLLDDGTARPLLNLEARSKTAGAAIPSSLLGTLRNASRVRISVIAETARSETLPGFPDELVLKAVSMHSVIMRINR